MISALATDALARTDVRSLGIIGTGPQAVAHVHAVKVVRPDVDRVVVAGRTAAHVAAVIDELVATGHDATPGSYSEAAGCDMVCAGNPRRRCAVRARRCSARHTHQPRRFVSSGPARGQQRSHRGVHDCGRRHCSCEGRGRRPAPGGRGGGLVVGSDRRRSHGPLDRTTAANVARGDHPVQERRPGGAGSGNRSTSRRGRRNHGGLVSKSVVIVGGGLVGLSSALFLTEAGAEVTIVDNGALGGGAARGNAGFMCTAIVEPLPAPGAIVNALKSLRDPQRALRVLPQRRPGDDTLAVGVRPQLHRVALSVGSSRVGEVQSQQLRDPGAAGHPGRRGQPQPRAARAVPRRGEGRAPLRRSATDGPVRCAHSRSCRRRRRDPPDRPGDH